MPQDFLISSQVISERVKLKLPSDSIHTNKLNLHSFSPILLSCSQTKCSSNQFTACKNACSLLNFSIFLLVSHLTLKPWLTPLYKLIWYGCLVSVRIVSDLWRFSAGKF